MYQILNKTILGSIIFILILAAAIADTEENWPREIETDGGIVTVYQPQPENFEDNVLQGRAAASWLPRNATEPTFGVFWFSARVDTDRDAGTSLVRDIVVTRVRWPDSDPEAEGKVARTLTELMPQKGIPIALEQLKASLLTAESEKRSLEGLKHNPPKIVVVEELAVLLQYDGEPRGVPIPDSNLEQIANAPFAVVRDKKSGMCYLSDGKYWYSAKNPKGPWTSISKPPAEIAKLVPPDTSEALKLPKAPKIVVATEPTELISMDGSPAWKPIGKGELLYIGNSETPVIREVATGKIFVLISGRWYTSGSLSGPWAVVRPDQTPDSFKDIPPSSDLGSVRVSVADTPEAEEAMLDAEVPQTAAIDRSTAKLEVQYDGQPNFKSISGTRVEYAVNTAAQVLRIDGKYYACDDGVWFVSGKATGPWAVADSVPMEEIKKIPPSEPVYNVTYVHIYESTPKVVYVGYTPGYLWSYPWYGCPVYGTGWHYRPYWGKVYYYPRPATFGMHVGYNPWTGWSFGFSYSTGFLRVGVTFGGGYGGYYRPGYPPHYYRPPYYPPGGYRPPYYPPGYRPGTPPRPTPYASRPASGQLSRLPANNNLYKKAENRDRLAPSTMQRDAALQKADRVAKGPNNVYADRSGNVYRQTLQGWESRDHGKWTPSSPSTRPAQPSTPATRPAQPSTRPVQPSTPAQRPSQPATRPVQPSVPATRPAQPSVRPSQPATRPSQPPPNLNRDVQARQQGAARARQAPSGSSRPAPRSGGGARRR
jgi:hypothetical protein